MPRSVRSVRLTESVWTEYIGLGLQPPLRSYLAPSHPARQQWINIFEKSWHASPVVGTLLFSIFKREGRTGTNSTTVVLTVRVPFLLYFEQLITTVYTNTGAGRSRRHVRSIRVSLQ
jgi:hypothetical protein